MEFVDKALALQGDSPPSSVKLVLIQIVWTVGYVMSCSVVSIFVGRTLVKMKLRSKYGVLKWRRGGEVTFLPMLKSLAINSEILWLWYAWEDSSFFTCAWGIGHCYWWVARAWWNRVKCKPTPNLLYLEYSDFAAEDYPKVNLTNLVEAQLNLLVASEANKSAT